MPRVVAASAVNGANALNPGGMAARTNHGSLQSSGGEAEAQMSFNDVFSLRLTSKHIPFYCFSFQL